jgi:hypothetical protein
MAFDGHASDSTSKAIYTDPTTVAPADRLYATDGADAGSAPDTYDPDAFTAQPGAAARANHYPRLS